MVNLRVSLADAGATLDDVVRTTVYVASSSQRDLNTAWEVVSDALAQHDPPSTLLGVTALGYDGQLVEVDAVAPYPVTDAKGVVCWAAPSPCRRAHRTEGCRHDAAGS